MTTKTLLRIRDVVGRFLWHYTPIDWQWCFRAVLRENARRDPLTVDLRVKEG